MPFDLGSAFFTVRVAGARQVIGVIQQVKSSVLGLVNPISGLTTAIGGIGLGMGIVGLVKLQSQIESTQVSFEVLLGSVKDATKLLADLRQFAAETPLEEGEIKNAARQLLAYGFTVKEIIPTLRMLGDVASGLQQPLGSLVYLHGTLRTQGRAYMMDIRQLQNRGIPIMDELAKVLHTSVTNISELVSAGRVGFKEVEAAFQGMTSTGGKYADMMKKQSQTLGGLWSTLKDMMAIKVFMPISKAVTEIFHVRGAMQALSSWADRFGVTFGKSIDRIRAFFVSETLTGRSPFTRLLDELKPLGTVLKNLWETIPSIIDLVTASVSSVWDMLSGLFQLITGADISTLQKAADYSLAFKASLIELTRTAEFWVRNWALGMSFVGTSFQFVFAVIQRYLVNVFDNLKGVWKFWQDYCTVGLQLLWEKAKLTFANIWGSAKNAFENMVGTLQWLWASVKTVFTNIGDFVGTILGNLVANMRDVFSRISFQDLLLGRVDWTAVGTNLTRDLTRGVQQAPAPQLGAFLRDWRPQQTTREIEDLKRALGSLNLGDYLKDFQWRDLTGPLQTMLGDIQRKWEAFQAAKNAATAQGQAEQKPAFDVWKFLPMSSVTGDFPAAAKALKSQQNRLTRRLGGNKGLSSELMAMAATMEVLNHGAGLTGWSGRNPSRRPELGDVGEDFWRRRSQRLRAQPDLFMGVGAGEARRATAALAPGMAGSEFARVQSAVEKLIKMGTPLEDIRKRFDEIDAVASGLGVPFNALAENLRRVGKDGKISFNELRGMTKLGIPAFEMMALATGKSDEEVKQMAKDGQISAELFQQAFAALSDPNSAIGKMAQGKGLFAVRVFDQAKDFLAADQDNTEKKQSSYEKKLAARRERWKKAAMSSRGISQQVSRGQWSFAGISDLQTTSTLGDLGAKMGAAAAGKTKEDRMLDSQQKMGGDMATIARQVSRQGGLPVDLGNQAIPAVVAAG